LQKIAEELVEETVVDEPIVEETIVDDTIVSETVVDESAIDEIVVDEEIPVEPSPLVDIPLLEGTYVEGEVLVKYKAVPFQTFSADTSEDGVVIMETLSLDEEGEVVLLQGDNGETTAELLARLSQDPRVEYVEPNQIFVPFSLPYNDTYTGQLRGLYNANMEAADIDWLPAMQVLSQRSLHTGVSVAVIDVGIRYNHPDLINQLWTGACVDSTGANRGQCLYGYDAVNDSKTNTPYGTNYHGTHVAGIIGAEMNNGKGIIGVNPYAKLMLINTNFTASSLIKAINFARHNGAKVINASW
jgi:subtilisin family serine protease